jgi:hypothetical protein
VSPPLYSTDHGLGSEAASRPSNNRNRPPRVLSLALTRVSLDSHAAIRSSNGTDGCIRKCGGFILAYLVTGFSGVCRAHSAPVSSRQAQPTKCSKISQSKKKGCGSEARSGKKTSATKWNRTQMQGSTQSNASVVECQQESIIVLWTKNLIDLT